MHVHDVKNSRFGHDIHITISVNDRVILTFSIVLISYAKFRENKTLAKIFEFTVFNTILSKRSMTHTFYTRDFF